MCEHKINTGRYDVLWGYNDLAGYYIQVIDTWEMEDDPFDLDTHFDGINEDVVAACASMYGVDPFYVYRTLLLDTHQ